jgi:hypothetical protein
MKRWSEGQIVLAGVMGSAGLIAFNLAWTAIQRYRGYKHAPPGWIIDFSTPRWVTAIGDVGLLVFLLTAITSFTFAIRAGIRSKRKLG